MGISSLPNELLLEVLSYLPLREFREFSACSKHYRQLCLPRIFRCITLHYDSFKAFGDGGSLAHIRNAVRQITFNPNCKDKFELPILQLIEERIDYYRFSAATLQLLPNVSEMIIRLASPIAAIRWLKGRDILYKLDGILYHKLFASLAAAEVHSSGMLQVKCLRLHVYNNDRKDNSGINTAMGFFGSMSEENLRLLGLIDAQSDSNGSGRVDIPEDKTAQEFAAIDTPFFSFLEEAEIFFDTFTKFPCITQANPLAILQYSSSTLRSLELTNRLYKWCGEISSQANPFVFPFPSTIVFSNVKRLGVTPGYFSNRYSEEIILRFPSVETLKVMVTNMNSFRDLISGDMEEDYRGIGGMKNLRRVLVPGPYTARVGMTEDSWENLALAIVDNWINGGITELEKVCFAKTEEDSWRPETIETTVITVLRKVEWREDMWQLILEDNKPEKIGEAKQLDSIIGF
ncbi:hypothetical protein ABW20_dc0102403 [Dactylellina cionopaga]|nr:hypothetical protein ABW20_dc0102403 [Dactylellina cionopaga]